jgi:tetratricopeptide (TPR) repeat protein
MARKKKKTTLESSDSEVTASRDSLAAEAQEERPEQQAFPPDQNTYEFWADSTGPDSAGQSSGQSQPSLTSVQLKRFSAMQKILVAGIVAVAAMLVYALVGSSAGHVSDLVPVRARQQEPAGRETRAPQPESSPTKPADDSILEKPPKIEEAEAAVSPVQPLSLAAAETFYLQKDYNQAYVAYDQLRQALPAAEVDDLLKDFLELKMAFCMKKAGHVEQANRLFKTLLQSRVPAIRALACYQQSLAEVQNHQYLEARAKAYQTIALVETIDFYRDWTLSLERDCHFLVPEALTRSVLSLCDADKDLPPQLWSHSLEGDPFINVSEVQLRSFLNAGSDRLRRALLGPQIERFEAQDAVPRWSVLCYGASIEELLARFAAHASLDVQWDQDQVATSEAARRSVRKKPTSLCISAATAQQLTTVAAGSVGLLARLDEKGTLGICNPSAYSSLSEHIAMLGREAISLWQRFLLTSVGDDRIANAHFALGLLKAQTGELTDATAEYKLVANRFSHTALAPYALLHSSRLKVKLRDFAGAREDLKQLIELYPDVEFSDRACLYLADATMKAGLFEEAARLYRRAYNLGISSQSQMASALGAGRCLYEKKDYEEAATWLARFIHLAKDFTSIDFNLACFLLGRTYLALGKPQQACDALEFALAGRLPRQEYIGAVSALVEANIQLGRFVEALNVLEKVRPWQFSQQESVELLLLKAGVLRSMGLFDKAILVLGDRAEYLLDLQLKAKVLYELAKCQDAYGDLEEARRNLTEVLVLVEAGPFAYEVGCELADVCLQLGQDSQVVSICSQLLDSNPPAPIRQRALDLLAKAHVRQKNYEGAVLALLGQPKAIKQPSPEGTSGSMKTGDQKPFENGAQ